MSKAKPQPKKPMSKADKMKYAQTFAKAMTNRLGEKAAEGASSEK